MPLETARAMLRWALLALLVLSPLPFGSVTPWAVLTIELWAAVLGAAAVLILARDPEGLSSRARWLLLPAAAIAAIGFLQLLPLPRAWTRLVAAPTAAAREEVSRLLPEISSALAPQSLEPPATTDALMRFLAYVLIGLAAAVAIRTPAHLRQAALAIAASGAFQGIYGAAEYLTGHQEILGHAKKYCLDEATGTFVNRNHFAAYLAMSLPFALGLVIESWEHLPRVRSWRERFLGAWEPEGRRLLYGGFAAAAIWAGVILSYSRSGLAVAILATALVAFASARKHRAAWVLLAVLATPTVLLLWQQVRAPGERFVSGSESLPTLNERLPTWLASVKMIPDSWLLGTGLGTFEPAFDLHRTPEIRGRWDHAHNDWLEGCTDGGLLVLAAVVGLATGCFLPRGDGLRARPPDRFVSILGAAAAAAALGCFVDFWMRIPAIAVFAAVIVATRGGPVASSPEDLGSTEPVSRIRRFGKATRAV